MNAPDVQQPVPAGFEPMDPYGPFHELVGPMYFQPVPGGVIVGLQVLEKHRNRGPMMHGGMLATLIDTACTWATFHSQEQGVPGVTTNLSINMIGSVMPGDWVQAHAEVVRTGRRAVFLTCSVSAGGRAVAEAVSQFMPMTRQE